MRKSGRKDISADDEGKGIVGRVLSGMTAAVLAGLFLLFLSFRTSLPHTSSRTARLYGQPFIDFLLAHPWQIIGGFALFGFLTAIEPVSFVFRDLWRTETSSPPFAYTWVIIALLAAGLVAGVL